MDSKKDLQSRHSISLKPSISDLQDVFQLHYIRCRKFCQAFFKIFLFFYKIFPLNPAVFDNRPAGWR